MNYFKAGNTDSGWMQWAGYDDAALITAAARVAAQRGAGGGLRTLAKMLNEIEMFYPDEKLTARGLMRHAQTFGHIFSR